MFSSPVNFVFEGGGGVFNLCAVAERVRIVARVCSSSSDGAQNPVLFELEWFARQRFVSMNYYQRDNRGSIGIYY